MGIFRKFLRVIERFEVGVAILLFLIIVFSITLQVISRYGFGTPFVWVEEVATYAFIWIVFLGASIGMKRLSHIKIEALSLSVPVKAQALIRIFGYAIMGFVLFNLIINVPKVMQIEARSESVSLPIPVARMWFYSMPLFVSTVSMSLTLFYYTIAEVGSLKSGKPMCFIDNTPITEVPREGV